MQNPFFKLYITGQTPRSERAIANLKLIGDELLNGEFEYIVIDVLEQPHLAEADRVIVTPTLIKLRPAPTRRVLGDLTDTARVLSVLNLHQRSAAGDAQ